MGNRETARSQAKATGRKDSVVTLREDIVVPGVGTGRAFAGETVSTAEGSFCLLIFYIRRATWVQVIPRRVWIKEDLVVSRTYIEPGSRPQEAADATA